MRPGAILVSIVSLLLSLSAVVWLSNSMSDVDVEAPKLAKPEIADLPDTPRPSSDGGPQPKAEFAETKFDFGIMRLLDKGSHVFRVTNSGDAPLKLRAGKSTCQCTVGEVGIDEVAPGETTTIELSWEIRNPNDFFEHSAVIHTNAPEHEHGEVRLIVQGRVAKDVESMPPESLYLGSLPEEGLTESFMVFSRIHDKFEVLSAESPNKSCSIEFAPLDENGLKELSMELGGDRPEALAAGQGPPPMAAKFGYKVTVNIDGNLPVGSVTIPVTLRTSLPDAEQLTYQISGRRPPPFQFFPLPGTKFIADKSIVSTSEFDAEQGKTMELLMLASGLDEALNVSVESTEPAWMEASVTGEKSNQGVPRQRLTIRIPPGSPPVMHGLANPAKVRLKTNHPKAETLTLDVTFLAR